MRGEVTTAAWVPNRTAPLYGFHDVVHIIALVMLRCGRLGIRILHPKISPTKTGETYYI